MKKESEFATHTTKAGGYGITIFEVPANQKRTILKKYLWVDRFGDMTLSKLINCNYCGEDFNLRNYQLIRDHYDNKMQLSCGNDRCDGGQIHWNVVEDIDLDTPEYGE